MVLLAILFAGTVACMVPGPSVQGTPSVTDFFSFACLFLLLSLTFSISFYGVKRLAEKSPKKILPVTYDRGSNTPYEAISF